MKEKLQKILEIKAEIKSALISHNIIEVSDDFSTYPELIKSLKEQK